MGQMFFPDDFTNEVSVEIKRVWVDFDMFFHGTFGMIIHVRLTTENLLGESIYVLAYLYHGNNTTPICDSYGQQVICYEKGQVNYNPCLFEDFRVFVPYDDINVKSGWSGNLSFDIGVIYNNKILASDNNHQFTFTRGYS